MIILYTLPTCGICHIMKQKLLNKNISFEERNLEEYVKQLNVQRAPVLQVENTFYYSPTEINDWINNY